MNKIPKNIQNNIRNKINLYATDPKALGNNVIQLTNQSYYRLRVGDYRIIFDENDTIIHIYRIATRGDAYKH